MQSLKQNCGDLKIRAGVSAKIFEAVDEILTIRDRTWTCRDPDETKTFEAKYLQSRFF